MGWIVDPWQRRRLTIIRQEAEHAPPVAETATLPKGEKKSGDRRHTPEHTIEGYGANVSVVVGPPPLTGTRPRMYAEDLGDRLPGQTGSKEISHKDVLISQVEFRTGAEAFVEPYSRSADLGDINQHLVGRRLRRVESRQTRHAGRVGLAEPTRGIDGSSEYDCVSRCE